MQSPGLQVDDRCGAHNLSATHLATWRRGCVVRGEKGILAMWDTDTARHTIVAHPTQVDLYRLSSAWLAVPAFIEELFAPHAALAPGIPAGKPRW